MFQAFNVLHYELGQKYNSHYDAFDPAEYGPQKSQRVNIKLDEFSFVIVLLVMEKDVLYDTRANTVFVS